MAPLDYKELNDIDYIRFRDLILERSGLYFSEQKRLDLGIGLTKALTESRLITSKRSFDLNAYYTLLRDTNNPMGRTELTRLINILTIGETYFFRDEAQFDALVYQVLPEIIATKRKMAAASGGYRPPQLRLWSAGCASGEEPYSLAILLKELLPDISRWNILILGTDINADVLTRAKAAVYTNWSFRESRAKAFRSQYFSQEPEKRLYQLRDDIRQMVTYNELNLTENIYPSFSTNTVDMDLIVCRNVTIYFKQDTTQAIINRFYEAIRHNGWLMVGHAESSLNTYRAFQPRSFTGAMLYQKTGQGLPDFNYTPPPQPAKIAFSYTPPPPPTIPKPPTIQPTLATAQLLLEQGKVTQAIEQLQQLLQIGPKSAAIYSLLGRAYADMGRWTQAKEMCDKAIILDTFNIPAYLTLASVYQEENKFDLAVTNLKKATFLDHKAPVPYFNLAMLYRKMGQFDQAKRHLQIAVKVLEKKPPEDILPDTGGKTVRSLLNVCHHLLMTWQTV